MRDLFADAASEDHGDARPEDNRCTPDLLLAWMLSLGRSPTLAECKDRFGGILGPMVCGWKLQGEGRWPFTEATKDAHD